MKKITKLINDNKYRKLAPHLFSHKIKHDYTSDEEKRLKNEIRRLKQQIRMQNEYNKSFSKAIRRLANMIREQK